MFGKAVNNLAALVLNALEERRNAIVVIRHPADGDQAVIHYANGCFSDMLAQQPGVLAGVRLKVLKDLVISSDEWSALMKALRKCVPLDLNMRLQITGQEVCFGFGLTFKIDPTDNTTYGIMFGRDVTLTRRRASEDAASQRLLAAMFNYINVPVLLVQGDGMIVMSNRAYHRIIGYSAAELIGRSVQEFTPPDYLRAASKARAAYLLNGAYEMDMETITKSGSHLRVKMRSELLPEAQEQRLRVITLIPVTEPPLAPLEQQLNAEAGEQDLGPKKTCSVGQLQTISLAAIKAAAGVDWSQVASSAMLLVEEIIRRHLNGNDTLCRTGDDAFVIWFDSADNSENDLVLSGAIREIRLRFLVDFGKAVSGHVSGVVVTGDDEAAPTSDRASPSIPSAALQRKFGSERHTRTLSMQALLQEVRDLQALEIGIVTDRNKEVRPLVMMDLPRNIRSRFGLLSTSVVQSADRAGDIDLSRLKLAIREIEGTHRGRSILLPISWHVLTSPELRWSIDECLGKIEHAIRRNLILAVSGVPPLPSDNRWKKTVDPFLRQFGNIGLIVTLARDESASAAEAMVSEWAFTLLMIDAADQTSANSEKYFNLISTARKRNIEVLVRSPDDKSFTDWKELGATMFIAGG